VGAVAHQLSAGFVPIRKKGKLPHETVRIAYSLEYGVDEMEMHVDAVKPGEKVILVDDLIATGGTAVGATKLLRQIGAEVVVGLLRHRPAGSRRSCQARRARRRCAHAGGILRALTSIRIR
jgi:adenine phosphoribosyltransferase